MRPLAFGVSDLALPTDAVAAFGARAILSRGVVDILYDRRDVVIDDAFRDEFVAWMETTGLPWLDKEATRIRTDEDRLHRLDDGRFHIACNAQASHGYLYITGWMASATA